MRPRHGLLLSLVTLVLYSLFLLWGVQKVPFHPDESSLLYQSRDLEAYLHGPRALAWDASKLDDADQVYRLLNAPLTKYLLGLSRQLIGKGGDDLFNDIFNTSQGSVC